MLAILTYIGVVFLILTPNPDLQKLRGNNCSIELIQFKSIVSHGSWTFTEETGWTYNIPEAHTESQSDKIDPDNPDKLAD